MARVVVSADHILSGKEGGGGEDELKVDPSHTYWRAENHTAGGGGGKGEGSNTYQRAEEWLQDVEDLTLSEGLRAHVEALREQGKTETALPASVERQVVGLSLERGVAMLRYGAPLISFTSLPPPNTDSTNSPNPPPPNTHKHIHQPIHLTRAFSPNNQSSPFSPFL